MAKTTRELVYRAMTELGRLYAGDVPSDGDYSIVEELLEPMVDQLAADNVVLIEDIDAIEPRYFLPLARLLALEASGSFGTDATASLLTNSRAANVDVLKDREMMTLRRVASRSPTGEVLRTDYF